MTIVSLSIFQFDQHRVIDRGPQQRQRKNHRSNRVSENVTNRTNVPGTRYTQRQVLTPMSRLVNRNLKYEGKRVFAKKEACITKFLR